MKCKIHINALWGSCNGEVSLGIFHFQDHFKQKMSLSPIFWLFGGVSAKYLFCQIKFFFRPIFTCVNTTNSFFNCSLIFSKYFFSNFALIWIFWELRLICAKFWKISIHGEMNCQSLLLLTPFFNIANP